MNLYTASAGVSGQGKGAADSAGSDAVYFHDCQANDLDAVRPSIGSGEGLARLFSGGKGQDALTRAHLIVPEVKTLEALIGRQGYTLGGELLKGYMGEPLGFDNAQKDTTTSVPEHSYRLCLGVGVQPENAVFFLSREKDGFPQRFLWLPTIDPYAPEERPAPVDPLPVLVPAFNNNRGERHVVAIPDSARDEIDAHRHRVLVGDPTVDPLDGHLMLTRLKVAFAIAVLHGRGIVDEDEWKIAGELLNVSVRVREQMRTAVAAARRRQNTAKAHDQAEHDEIVSDGKLTRCKQAIDRNVPQGRLIARHDLRRKVRADLRIHFDTAIAQLIDERKVEEISTETGTAYTCTTCTRPPTSEKDPCPDGTRVRGADGMPEGDQRKPDKVSSPPGAPTAQTPGMTDRVKAALANANGNRPKCTSDGDGAPANTNSEPTVDPPNYGRFTPARRASTATNQSSANTKTSTAGMPLRMPTQSGLSPHNKGTPMAPAPSLTHRTPHSPPSPRI